MGKIYISITKHIQIILICGICCASSSDTFAQENSSWWKNIFRSKVDTLSPKTSIQPNSDTHFVEPSDSAASIKLDKTYTTAYIPQRTEEGSLVINMNKPISILDLESISHTQPLKGYRVQIHFGDLETARAVRAHCRRQIVESPVYLESIAPNYSVTIGNFRNRWEAEIALQELIEAYPTALIMPVEIELPQLH